MSYPDGGPAQRIILVDDAPAIAGSAQPVAIVTDGRPVLGGPPLRCRIVTDRNALAGPALPVVVVEDAGIGVVLPIVLV